MKRIIILSLLTIFLTTMIASCVTKKASCDVYGSIDNSNNEIIEIS